MTRPEEPDFVHVEANDAGAYLPDGGQYPLPELSDAEATALEERTAAQVLTVRDELSLTIANLGADQVAHFIANVDGREVCGGDGEPWPCQAWIDEVQPAAVQASADTPAPVTYSAAEVAMAEELGITAAEVRERMRAR
jgi:hypothetical protein